MDRKFYSPRFQPDAPIILPGATRPGSNLRSSSAAVIGSTRIPKPTKNSKNPYQRTVSSTTSSQYLAHEAEQGGRTYAPARTVFDDLRTAHSSITSGSARNGLRHTSNNTSELHDDDSIPLQDMEAADPHEESSILSDTPRPPLPAVLSSNHLLGNRPASQQFLVATDRTTSKQRSRLELPPQSAQTGSFFATIKHAFVSISHPLTREGGSEMPPHTASHWPTDTPRSDSGARRSSLQIKKRASRPQANTTSPQEADMGGPLRRSRTMIGGTPYLAPSKKRSSVSWPLPESGSINGTERETPNHRASSNDNSALKDKQDELHPQDLKSPAGGNHSKGLPQRTSNVSSLPDVSTVSNIYMHYVQTDGIDGVTGKSGSDVGLSNHIESPGYFNRHSSSGFPSSPRIKSSALNSRKLQRSQRSNFVAQGQPPEFTLPEPPSSTAIRHVAPTTPQALGHSSSYGDSKKLLQITQPSNSTNVTNPSQPEYGSYPNSAYALSEIGEFSEPSLPSLNSNNPYRDVQGPEIAVSSPDTNTALVPYDAQRFRFDLNDRLPLERDVSNALRRASGYSAYSNGSISTAALGRYEDCPSETSTYKAIRSLIKRNETSAPSDLENVPYDRLIANAQGQAFYDQQAIPSNWVSTQQHNMVRVPINHNGSFPDSPPESPPGQIETHIENRRPSDDTNNDWETVGESIPAGRYDHDMLGGTVRRTGSSIANTSDPGNTSPYVAELNELSSTDRITRHPSNISYSGDYRQRDLKNTRIPIFLPVFREHKVNGYLSDSNRIRPPQNRFYESPAPLMNPHTNPFKSTPPEVIPSRKPARRSNTISYQRSRNGSRFPILSIITQSSDGGELEVPKTRNSNPVSEDLRSSSWMDEFGDPGPVVNPQDDPFLAPRSFSSPSRPTSWQHIMTFGRGDSVPGYNSDGTRTNTARSKRHPEKHSSGYMDTSTNDWEDQTQSDGFVETKIYGGRDLAHAQGRKPLVKGPPGAFYQGVRSKFGLTPKKGGSQSSRDGTAKSLGARRSSAKENYPTNVLRPISLIATHHPVTPTNDKIGDVNNNERLENDFVYRSPLAPPKRNTWLELYNPVQLNNFRDFAKADGLLSSRKSIGAGRRDSMMGFSAQKHTFEAPRLGIWSQDEGVRTDLVERKRRVSTCLLVLSAVFPPFLVLYATGYLDGVVLWWTDGECSALGKKHKKVALFLIYLWGIVIFLGLVSFLVFWFAIRPRES